MQEQEQVLGRIRWKSDENEHGRVFFDDEAGSESYGEGVTNCSGCGERLHRGMLTPA